MKDVSKGIGGKLHDLWANPVLDGDLKYAGAPNSFKIRDILNEDGTSINLDKVDESAKKIVGYLSTKLLITTDPEQFFNIVKKSESLVILIAPKFLIEEKIGSSAKPFQLIMAEWKEDQAPIGIFYRNEKWKNLSWYNYLTFENILTISKNDLRKNWLMSEKGVRAPGIDGFSHPLNYITCSFLTKN